MATTGDTDRTPRGAAPDERVELLTRKFRGNGLVALRHEVEAQAERNGLTDLALYQFVVAINEIATNAVEHGGGAGRLELWRQGGRVCCSVTDEGNGLPAGYDHNTERPQASAVRGRGLWLARQFSDDFTVHSDTNGTRVTLAGPPSLP